MKKEQGEIDFEKIREIIDKLRPNVNQPEPSGGAIAVTKGRRPPADEKAILPHFSGIARTAKPIDLLADFVADLKTRQRSEYTITAYRSTCADFINFIGALPLHAVKPRDIRDFLAWRCEQGDSNSSIAVRQVALRAFFKHLEMLSIVSVSPARSIAVRRQKRPLPKALTVEQIDKLIEAAQNPRDKALIETFYSTGCRLAEVASMRIENIQQDNGRFTIRVIGKGDKERIVPLNSRAVELLRPVIGDRKKGFVFRAWYRPPGSGSINMSSNGRCWTLTWFDRAEIQEEAVSVQKRVILGYVRNADNENREPHEVNGRMLKVLTREQAEDEADWFLTVNLNRTPKTPSDQSIGTRAISTVIASCGMRAGIGKIHPHMLRHSFATHLYDNGADIFTVKELLGHSLIQTTAIYMHTSPRKLAEIMENFHPHWKGTQDAQR